VIRDILRMARKTHSGGVEDALVHGGGYQGIEATPQACARTLGNRFQDVRRILRVESSAIRSNLMARRPDVETSRFVKRCPFVGADGADPERLAQELCPVFQ